MRICLLILSIGFTAGVQAQWLNHRDPEAPRTKDGKPNLSAPAPRSSNGKPDLSGIWQAEGAPLSELKKLLEDGINGLGEDDPPLTFFNVLADFKPEEAPMRPEVAAEWQKRAAAAFTEPPPALCVPPSTPLIDSFPSPYKIVETPKLVLMLYEVRYVLPPDFHGWAEAPRGSPVQLAWIFDRKMGGRYAGGGNGRIKRQEPVGYFRPSPQ